MTFIRSSIVNNLITSYHDTLYQVGIGPDAIVLRIGQRSESLTKLLEALNQSRAAIISAYNPCSRLVANEANSIAHEFLKNYLNSHPYTYIVIESLNIDPSGKWPLEKSFFVSGLDLDRARSIGQQFNQNAIVWIDNEAIPRLELLR